MSISSCSKAEAISSPLAELQVHDIVKKLSCLAQNILLQVFINDRYIRLRKAWSSILESAHVHKLLSRFDEEVLSRLDQELFYDETIIEKIVFLFQKEQGVLSLFLHVATSQLSIYLNRDEFNSLLDDFSFFISNVKEEKLGFYENQIPFYSQGGRQWFARFKTKNKSAAIDKEVRIMGSMKQKTLFESHVHSSKDEEIFTTADREHIQKILDLTNQDKKTGEKLFVYWLKIIKENFGNSVFILLTNPASFQHGCCLSDVIRLLQQVVEIGEEVERIKPLLLKFKNKKINLKNLLQEVELTKNKIDEKKYPEKRLEEVLEAFGSNGKESLVSFPLAKSELDHIALQYKKIAEFEQQLRKTEMSSLIETVQAVRMRARSDQIDEEDRLKIIAIAREAMRVTFGISPYNTQVLALLGLVNHPERLKGRIAQVRTGEGKSTIIAMLAFYQACLGNTVDIVSSSRYLAKRDHDKYRDYFHAFHLTTSHICKDHPLETDFQAQIIFGTHYDFEFALMRDMLQEKELRLWPQEGGMVLRPCETIIVDEVDNLFIDSAFNSARIGIPAKTTYHWVYHPILEFVQDHKEEVKSLREGDLSNRNLLFSTLNEHLSSISRGEFKDVVQKIEKEKLEIWLQSAYEALYVMKLNHDYVIKPTKSKQDSDAGYKNGIVIVDKQNTGRLNEGSRWQNGLHEFLEAKHDLSIEEENVMPVSLCHPTFFENYRIIYGLTGTIGSDCERKEIEKMYNIDAFDVPTHTPNKRQLYDAQLLSSKELQSQAIIDEIVGMQKAERPTLVLFESIEETIDFSRLLKEKKIHHQILNERQAEHEDYLIMRAGAPRAVTIATNTAGRGTDIILHPASLHNGGLHVVFAFFPQNDRVEQQGFGRAARQGQPGSCRLVVHMTDTLDQARKKRSLSISLISKQRLERVMIEQINHKYTMQFFTGFKTFVKEVNDDFFAKFAERKMVQIKRTNFHDQNSNRMDMNEDEIELRKKIQSSKDTNSLNMSLKALKAILSTKILQEWAVGFYGRLDILHRQVMKKCAQEVALEVYNKEIAKLYAAQRLKWEKFFSSPAKSFSAYCERVMAISE